MAKFQAVCFPEAAARGVQQRSCSEKFCKITEKNLHVSFFFNNLKSADTG